MKSETKSIDCLIDMDTVVSLAENYRIAETAREKRQSEDYLLLYGCCMKWTNAKTNAYLSLYLKLRE